MKILVRTLCAAVVAAPLGFAASPSFAQLNVDPDLGTSCSRNDMEPCGSRGFFPFKDRHVYRDHRPGDYYWHDRRDDHDRYWRKRRHHYDVRDAHEEWCYGTYRSYRAWDNTFKPYDGPRQQCRSPYG
jgi:hypothetical protein